MPQSPGVWQAPKRTSIDATTPDGGLDAARSAYPHAGGHSTIAQAVQNALSGQVSFGRTVQLIGHGMPGLIAVGCGKGPLGHLDYLAMDNHSAWAPVLGALAGHVQALRLTGCMVGAEAEGADLVEAVACAVEAPVLAPTGEAFAVGNENIVLQDGGLWQVGQCNIAPHPIPVPNDPTPSPTPALAFITPDGSPEIVPVERVVALDFEPRPRFGKVAAPGAGIHATDQDAQGLAHTFDPEHAHPLPGEPLAFPTGQLSISYLDDTGAQRVRNFQVLADRLLIDPKAPGYYYRVDESLREALRSTEHSAQPGAGEGPAER